MLEDMAKTELLPEEMTADAAYGSDEDQQLTEKYGVELVSPVSGHASARCDYRSESWQNSPPDDAACCSSIPSNGDREDDKPA